MKIGKEDEIESEGMRVEEKSNRYSVKEARKILIQPMSPSYTHNIDHFNIRETWVLNRFIKLFMSPNPFVEILNCFLCVPFEVLLERREAERGKSVSLFSFLRSQWWVRESVEERSRIKNSHLEMRS